jgi:gamma-glutamylcyclotransferase (GGCT)/AIG2-like uncharacterized protein YtfP
VAALCRGRAALTGTVRLFSYGSLQQREVQLANYGRALVGQPDALRGYRLEPLRITDPEVVRLSGKAVHVIARETADPADRIPGMVFELSEAELAATDAYETADYRRIEVTLESGTRTWAYVGRPVSS